MLICSCPACLAARGENDNVSAIDVNANAAGATAPAAPAALPQVPSYAISAVYSGYQWGALGTGPTVTYSFLTSVPSYYASNAGERANFVMMNAAQIQAARDTFAAYAEVSNIRFQEVAAGSGSINLGTADLGAGIGGWAYYPRPGYTGSNDGNAWGDVWVTNRFASYTTPLPGSHVYLTYIHEIGHAIGLKHPGNYNAGGGGTPGPYLPAAEDSSQYTVMSYYNGPTYSSAEPISPQLYDIAAVQYLYGVNMSTRAGNDIYSFSTSFQAKTVWDAGGTDTFDASNQTSAVVISLQAGTFSSIAGVNNIAIAFGASIEAALGSNYNDTLRAGDQGGTLNGGSGNDILVGAVGADRLIGGIGRDTLTGGVGIDTFAFFSGDASSLAGQHDLIADFLHGTDLIDLSGFDADMGTAGINPFHFLGSAAFDGMAAALNFVFDATNNITILRGDTNGDLAFDFAIDFSGSITLTRDDFTASSLRPLVALTLDGTGNADTLLGDALGDTLSGMGGTDTLRGFVGNDYLDGGSGADVMEGGAGDDTYVVDNAGDVVTEAAGVAFTAPAGWTLKGMADFNRDGNADAVVTSGGSNQIWLLRDGAVTSAATVDYWPAWALQGVIDRNGDGYAELLYQHSDGRQQINYFNGTTKWTFAYEYTTGLSPDPVAATGNEGTDLVRSSISYTLASGVENLTLLTGSGNINGTGNASANVITGNEGDNILTGKAGVDTLTGGLGIDTFAFGLGDTGSALGQRDLITDFTIGIDKLDLSTIDADTTRANENDFRFLDTSAFDGQGGALRYSYDSGRNVTTLEVDRNGDRAADFAIEFTGNKAFTAADFTPGSLLVPVIATGDGNANTLVGGELGDTLSGLGGNDTLRSFAGNDTLDGGTGADVMEAGEGDDIYVVDDLGDVVTEVSGIDLVRSSISYTLGGGVENLTLLAGTGNINGTGNASANAMTGNEGNNILTGKAGVDTLTGGLGIDTFAFGLGDTGAALGSRDLITDFTIGTDKLDLSSIDADTLRSGANDFRFLGASAFDGQGGALRYSYDSGRNVTVLEADTNGDRVADLAIEFTGNKVFTDADFTPGSLLVPVIATGDGNANTLVGGELGDTLSGLGGNDTLRSFAGNDTLDGGTGADVMEAGEGDDIYVVDDLGDVVTEVSGIDLVRSSISYTLGGGVENLTLLAGTGNNSGTGNASDNIIIGNDGDNILTGKAGVDTLTGGAGIDTFAFGLGDTGSALGSRDLITDFTIGTDKLDLSLIDADTIKTGENDFRFLGASAFDGQGGALRYIYDAGRDVTVLEADRNGDRAADFVIEFTGNKAFTAADFTPGSLLASVNATGDGNANTLVGGEVGDTLSGMGGADTLRGFAGNDQLDGGTGADVMEGGAGDDIYVVDDAGDVVTEQGGRLFTAPAGWTLKGMADFNRDGEADAVVTSGGSNQIWLLRDGAVASAVAVEGWAAWALQGVIDRNGDGYAELFYQHSDGRQQINYFNGTTKWTYAYEYTTGLSPDPVATTGNEGIDTILSSISTTLADNVENLTLSGIAATDGTGNASDNIIIGNDGANRLTGGRGVDTLTGGLGIDTFVFANGDSSAAAGKRDLITDFTIGTDKLDLSTIDADTLRTGANDFRFLGTSAFDGQGGALRYNYDAGRNVTILEADTNGDRTADFVIEFTGNKAFTDVEFTTGSLLAPVIATGDGNANTLVGGEVGDTLSGMGGNDTLRGFAGNDYLDGGSGADVMEGGEGDDIYVVDDLGDVVTEVAGIDLVRSSISYTLGSGVENLTLLAGAGNVGGTGNALANVITGNDGDNILTGKAGVDTLTSGLGVDTFAFGAGDTGSVLGSRDLVADFTIGTDKLDLSTIDADTTRAGENDFRFLGASAFDGQGGALRYSYDSGRNVTLLEADTNGDRAADFVIEFTGNKAFTDTDFTPGSLLAPVIATGDGNANTLVGGEANDTLSGMGGNDTLRGLAGNDLLDGGTGADTMEGGAGDDIYVVDNIGDVVTEVSGIDLVRSSINYTLGSAVENLTLLAGAGNINGTGNTANNVIIGNDGDNILTGGTGADTLTGGLGIDTFAFELGDTGAALGSRDLITDFTIGTDKLDLSSIDADTLRAGANDFRFLGASAFDGLGGALRYSYDAGRNVTSLEADLNGDRTADFAIEFTGNTAFTEADFTPGSLLLPVNLTGDGGANTLVGGEVSDTLSGMGGNDTLRGLAGNDLLDGGTGADVMEGGEGDDIYVVDDAGDVVTETSGVAFTAPVGWTLKGMADFNRDGNADAVVTSGGSNQIWLLQNGVVTSAATVDYWPAWVLQGVIDRNGDGYAELLYQRSSNGQQQINYFNGTTKWTFAYEYTTGLSPDPVAATGNEGIDLVRSSISYTLASGVENLTLLAGMGNINGTGNAAANVITGNEGDNILTGKAGADTLTGGVGIDTFVFGTGDTGAALGSRDVITDFTIGTDKLDLSTIDANTLQNGAQDFRFLGTSAFDGQGGALRYTYDAGRNVTLLEADTNGDRAADIAIELTGNKVLTETDFTAGSLGAGVTGPFASMGLPLDQVNLMGMATLAAFAGAPIPSGWTVITPAQLGLAATYRDGNYFTNPATEANAIVLQQGNDYIVSFRGTDNPVDVASYPGLFFGYYIDYFSPLLNAVAASAPAGSNFYFTGGSLGGGATNLMANIADTAYGGRFADATFVAFASPNISNANGILNLGFENDPVYKSVNFYGDFASTGDNWVAANSEYMAGNLDGRNPWSMEAHDGGVVTDVFSRLEQSIFANQMTLDSVVVVDDNAGLVQDLGAGRVNTGAFYLGQSVDDVIAGRSGNDYLEGFGGNDNLSGGAGNDSIAGGLGNDRLTGDGGTDTFVFKPNFGRDRVADYHAGEDIFQFDDIFANFADLLAHTTDDGLGNAVITANANDAVTLEGITKAVLQQNASDFQFV